MCERVIGCVCNCFVCVYVDMGCFVVCASLCIQQAYTQHHVYMVMHKQHTYTHAYTVYTHKPCVLTNTMYTPSLSTSPTQKQQHRQHSPPLVNWRLTPVKKCAAPFSTSFMPCAAYETCAFGRWSPWTPCCSSWGVMQQPCLAKYKHCCCPATFQAWRRGPRMWWRCYGGTPWQGPPFVDCLPVMPPRGPCLRGPWWSWHLRCRPICCIARLGGWGMWGMVERRRVQVVVGKKVGKRVQNARVGGRSEVAGVVRRRRMGRASRRRMRNRMYVVACAGCVVRWACLELCHCAPVMYTLSPHPTPIMHTGIIGNTGIMGSYRNWPRSPPAGHAPHHHLHAHIHPAARQPDGVAAPGTHPRRHSSNPRHGRGNPHLPSSGGGDHMVWRAAPAWCCIVMCHPTAAGHAAVSHGGTPPGSPGACVGMFVGWGAGWGGGQGGHAGSRPTHCGGGVGVEGCFSTCRSCSVCGQEMGCRVVGILAVGGIVEMGCREW